MKTIWARDWTTREKPITFLRYPGGKRRMLNYLVHRLPRPDEINGQYVEPFLGGGAVFFCLQPRQAFLSDINKDLIDLYLGIRFSPSDVWGIYSGFGRSKLAYNRARDAEKPKLLVERAARVLFLNRTCFKGMWRHNRSGKFNVGYGGQERRWVISRDHLVDVGRTLRKARIKCLDFEDVLDETDAEDFIFADPPYRPNSREQTNDHYIGRQFTFDDHRRLAAVLRRARKRGTHWALTTSAHPDIVSLFRGNCISIIPRGTGCSPGRTVANSGEVLITSYLVKEKSHESLL